MGPKKYVARWGFVLGHPLNQAVRVGEVLSIEGSSIVQNNQSFSMPSIRGAISNGWLILADTPEGKKIIEDAEAAELAGKSPKDAGFAHLSTKKPGEKTLSAEEDGIDVAAPKSRRRGAGAVETDADRTVGELKNPTQQPEFIVKG